MKRRITLMKCAITIAAFIVNSHSFAQGSVRFARVTSSSNNPNYNQGNCTGDDNAKAVTTDGKGNSYVVGQFTGTAAFGVTPTFTSLGSHDLFLEKYDNAGNPLWAVQSGGTADDDARSVAVYPDGAGGVNIYVTGFFTNSITFNGLSGSPVTINSVVANNTDAYMVKYRDNGTVAWARGFGSNAGGGITIGYDIAVSNNATTGTVDIWLSGSFTGTTFFAPALSLTSLGGQNGFIANFHDGAAAPNAIWVNGVLSGSVVAQAQAICPDQFGNVFLSGYWLYGNTANFGGAFNGIAPNGNDDGFVASYNGAGVIQNVMHFGQVGVLTPTQGTYADGIAVAEDGTVYTVGSFTGTSIFQTAPPFSLTSTGGPVIGSDGFLMKLNPATLGIVFLNQLSSPTADDFASRVVIDHCGKRCYVSGVYNGTENFGNSVTLTPPGVGYGTCAFVVAYDISNPTVGLAFNATQAGGNTGVPTKNTTALDLAVNAVEDVEYCGSFSSINCGFTPNPPASGALTNATVTGGVNDGFLARWDDSNWPLLENTGQAINQGVSVVDCIDYAVGDMTGSNVSFGSPAIVHSTSNGLSDVYLMTTDKYAVVTGFLQLMTGSSTETSEDLVSNATNHYVAGNAVTASASPNVTFAFDAADSYTAVVTFGSNAVVMKTNLAGTTGWGTSIRPGAANSSATGKGVAYDASGNVYFCGYFTGTVNVYSAGPSLYGSLVSAGGNDIFVVKYNSSGVVQWAKKIGGTGDDVANGISIDPSSSWYYITGKVSNTVSVAQGLAHAHTATGVFSDGFALKGNLNFGGLSVNDAFWTTASTQDWGTDVFSNGATEVYITGVKTAGKVYIASYDLSGTTSPLTTNWNVISTGGNATGNDILLGRNGYVYVSGEMNNNTLTFGSLPTITSTNIYGGYIVGIASWNGVPTWETTAFATAKYCNGLAEDVGYLMSDHGFICLFGGQKDFTTGSHAYVQKATQEGLEYSSRHGHPVFAANSSTPAEVENTLVYPNPFSNTTTLKLQSSVDLSAAPVSLVIFDMAGRIVNRVDEITTQETVISGEGLAGGIYFYEVVQNGNILSTGKMVVSK